VHFHALAEVLPQLAHRYPPKSGPDLSRTGDDVPARDHSWIVERQRGEYQEVVKPERLAFTYAFEDDAGRQLHRTIVTVTFAEKEGRTKITLHRAIFETVCARDDQIRGWSGTLP
jgi:uncharacterized protein YndB with AHSA1/START domain